MNRYPASADWPRFSASPACRPGGAEGVAAAGLVEVRQGDATTVRDFRRHAGLDLLPDCCCAAARMGRNSMCQWPQHSGSSPATAPKSPSWRPAAAGRAGDAARRVDP